MMHNPPPKTAPRPSERVRALIRRGAQLALSAPPEWLDELDEATLSPEIMRGIAQDPALAAALSRSNRANLLHWAASNVREPGAPVGPNPGTESLQVARDLVRRGVHETALHAFRTGQNAAWLRWMTIAFDLTSDPDELRELLDVSARSIHAFLDTTISSLAHRMQAEREALTRGTHADRREVVALVLDGAPIPPEVASDRLGYDLEGPHLGAVIWSERAHSELATLEAVAESLSRTSGQARALVVVASAVTLWVWIPGEAEPDLDRARAMVARQPGLRLALGTRSVGVEGFRRTHLDALTTQRLMARIEGELVASFDEVRLVSLVSKDRDALEAFVEHTLGDLAHASYELRRSLKVFLEEGSHSARAAARLRTHRNTLSNRLDRARALLPRPLETQRIAVAVALEVLGWERREKA